MSPIRRAFLAASLGALLAAGPAALVPGLAQPARAATPSVTVVAATTYDVLPEEHRVAITVALTATSHLRDTVTRQYHSSGVYLAVQPGTSNFHVSAAAGTPKVSVTARRATGTILLLTFASPLGAGRSTALTLTFDLVDPGGAPERPLRISPSLVSFPAWAYGTDGVAGSTVRVRLPAEYAVVVGRGPLTGPTTEPDGRNAWTSAALPTPTTFVADILADRPAVLVDDRRRATVDGRTIDVFVESWPDDPAWRARVSDLVVRGLPALDAAIGIGWPLGAQLTVRETLPLPPGGDAGSGTGGGTGAGEGGGFDPAASRLDIPYTADPTAIIHGAAHGWFNGRLVADRWIAEGFAELYAERAGAALKVAIASPVMTEAGRASALPLNAWVPGGAADAFGYAAALELARDVATQAGDTAMAAVWSAAARGEGAYQPGAGAPELGAGPVDWRALLDLLEAKTGASYERLWRAWVVRPGDAALLDARDAARSLYAATVERAGAWTLPRSIRDAMGAWRFDDATALLQAAGGVLDQRDLLQRQAVAAGLALPDALRVAFSGSDGIPVAAAEATTELAVIATYQRVAAMRPAHPDALTQIGLIGTRPDADIAAARSAFAAGDLDATLRHVDDAQAAWQSAVSVGQGRVSSVAGLLIALLVLAWLARRERRRTAERRSHAHRR